MKNTFWILVSLLSLIATRADAQQHLFTSNAKENPPNFAQESIVGYVSATKAAGMVPVFRWFQATTGDHLLTTDPNEPAQAERSSWTAEGIVFYAFPPTEKGMVPLKRLFNATTHDRLYTSDEAEIRSLIGPSWQLETVAFSVRAKPGGGFVQLRRLFNPTPPITAVSLSGRWKDAAGVLVTVTQTRTDLSVKYDDGRGPYFGSMTGVRSLLTRFDGSCCTGTVPAGDDNTINWSNNKQWKRQ